MWCLTDKGSFALDVVCMQFAPQSFCLTFFTTEAKLRFEYNSVNGIINVVCDISNNNRGANL